VRVAEALLAAPTVALRFAARGAPLRFAVRLATLRFAVRRPMFTVAPTAIEPRSRPG